MKAVQFARFGGADVLQYVEVPQPSPHSGDVLIEVTAAGVNYVDIRERQGIYQQAKTHVGGVTLTRIPGVQAIGIVTKVCLSGDQSLLGKKVVALLPDGEVMHSMCAPRLQ